MKRVRDWRLRFRSRVEVNGPDECWPWLGKLKPDGYGQLLVDGKNQFPHRMAVILDGREIPEGMLVDHICRNRSCVNPRHLRVVTHAENATENSSSPSALNKAKTHCNNGHPLAGDNLAIQLKNGKPKRRCRACAYAYLQRTRGRV